MRKLYSKFLLGLVATVCSYASMAQISVTATVGTVGPTSYTTLKGAFDAINAGTHKGVINISITGNTTETAKDSLTASGSGAASYTSIKIKPAAGVTPTITGAFSNNIIELAGASNVTIDGSNTVGGTTKDLTIQNTSTTGAAVLLNLSATGDTLKNTVFKGAFNGGPVIWLGVGASASTTGVNNNVIQNNDVTKSSGGTPTMAIWNIGSSATKPNSGNIYRGNRIFDFATYGYLDGGSQTEAYGFSTNTLFEGNEFYEATTQTGNVVGIYLQNSTSISGMTISKNNFHDFNTSSNTSLACPLYFYDALSVTVVNNMITMSGTQAAQYAIFQRTAAGSTVKIQHNTVSISGANATNESYAFVKDWTSTNDDIRNNIFVNTRTSTTDSQFVIANYSSTGTIASNYNDLVTTSNAKSFIGSNTTAVFATLANWQTGVSQDANSISVAPVFVSATNLHLNTASNPNLDNKGTGIATVTTDYDGDPRNATTPDQGMDEFTSTATCTNPVITAQPVAITRCLGTSATFSVTATGTSPTYQWRKAGANITGATSATYTIASVVAGDAANYDVVVSSGSCSVNSNAVALTVSGPCTAVPDVNSDITSVMIAPNVVRDVANVRVTASKAMKMTWNIVDAQGKVVMIVNSNVMPGKNDIALYVGQLSNGTYQVKGTSSKGVTSVVRFVKM